LASILVRERFIIAHARRQVSQPKVASKWQDSLDLLIEYDVAYHWSRTNVSSGSMAESIRLIESERHQHSLDCREE